MMKLGVVEMHLYIWVDTDNFLFNAEGMVFLYLRAYRNGDKMSKTVEKIKRVFEEESFTDD